MNGSSSQKSETGPLVRTSLQMSNEPDDLAPDLLDISRALTEHRARMSEPQLARVRERARAGGSQTTTAPRGGFMRSRIAVTALLATGALMSSTGAAVGVTALSTTDDASQAQYGPVETTTTATTPPAAVAPQGDTLGGGDEGAGPSSGVLSATDESAPGAEAQPARQLESSGGDTLPFTGYAAIPLLLAGLALLACGLVLRRGTDGRRLT
jgi:hypothetical protein